MYLQLKTKFYVFLYNDYEIIRLLVHPINTMNCGKVNN